MLAQMATFDTFQPIRRRMATTRSFTPINVTNPATLIGKILTTKDSETRSLNSSGDKKAVKEFAKKTQANPKRRRNECEKILFIEKR